MLRPLIQFLLISVSLIPAAARADWEANFSAISTKSSFPKSSGRFFSKAGQFRIDAIAPFEVSLYGKTGSPKLDAAIHSFHMKMTSSLGKGGGEIPACLAKSFAECAKVFKLKKAREEKCPNGPQTCEVYASTGGVKGVKRLEVWHWKGEKEAVLAKGIVNKTDGSIITIDFTDIARKTHDAGFYEVPANYKNAGPLEKFFGDFKGKAE